MNKKHSLPFCRVPNKPLLSAYYRYLILCELEELKNTPKDELFHCVYIYSLAEHAIRKAILRGGSDE